MSTTPVPDSTAWRTLVARATRAPSAQHEQPWRWRVYPDRAELELAPSSAPGQDPRDAPDHGIRESVIGCGTALFTLRVAAAEALFDVAVEILPAPERPDLLATVSLVSGAVDAAFSALDAVIDRRGTASGPFDERPLPDLLVRRLEAEAASEGISVHPLEADRRQHLRDLVMHAERADRSEKTSRSEKTDQSWRARAEEAELIESAPYVAVLATGADTRADWLAAGQGLQRLLLIAAGEGFSAGFLNAACRVPADREQLRELLPTRAYPQVVVRLGHVRTRPTGSRRHRPWSGDLPSPREAALDFSSDALG